jgi:hypothetical protein
VLYGKERKKSKVDQQSGLPGCRRWRVHGFGHDGKVSDEANGVQKRCEKDGIACQSINEIEDSADQHGDAHIPFGVVAERLQSRLHKRKR